MPVMPVFSDSWKRIERAREHLRDFVAEWNALQLSERLDIQVEIAEGSFGIVRAVLPAISNNRLTVLLGEFFYQLRAALDCAIYTAAVIVEGSDPPADVERLYFPIHSKQKQFKESAFYASQLPDNMKSWLEDLQPYNATRTEGTTLSEVNRTLALLHDCARKDRHRQLHLLYVVPENAEFTFGHDEALRVYAVEQVPCNLLDGDTVLLRFRVDGSTPDLWQTVTIETHLSAEVFLEAIPMGSGRSLADELLSMIVETHRIVQTFEAMVQQ